MKKSCLAALLLVALAMPAGAGKLSLEAGGGFFALNVEFEMVKKMVIGALGVPDVETSKEKPLAPWFGAGFSYGIAPMVKAGMNFAYWSATIESSGTLEDPLGLYMPIPLPSVSFTTEAKTTIIPILAHLTLEAPGPLPVKPYLRAGAGMAKITIDVTLSAYGASVPLGPAYDETEFGYGVIGGASFPIVPKVRAFLEGGLFNTTAEYEDLAGEKQAIGGYLGMLGVRINL